MVNHNLGIIGGTFNPIHYGHLIAAEYARMEYCLDSVVFVPACVPAHKEAGDILEAGHRYAMVEMAVQGNPDFQVSDLELKRKGVSYTVDTMDHMASLYPNTNLFFIMGMDALLMMDTWKQVERLAGMCHFIVVTRPGYDLGSRPQSQVKLPRILWDHVHYLEIPGMDISSTDIRTRVHLGKTIKYLVPLPVEQYIQTYQLYQGGE